MHMNKYKNLFNPGAATAALSFRYAQILGAVAGIVALAIVLGPHPRLEAQTAKSKAVNITGYYQFGMGDTLAILENHGSLQGHVDVFIPQEKPKPVLSYNITSGSVNRNQLEFKTQEVYGKHYRFSGKVKRGVGKDPGDYDYLELAGNLETISTKPSAGKQKIAQRHIVFKSLPQDNSGS